jgi:outer membrane protein assembly factor BamB
LIFSSLASATLGSTLARNLCRILLVVCIAFPSSSFAHLPFATSRGDNTRDGANTIETLLTPTNVNKASFGHLFSFPVDYVVMAQPLYMPNVNIPGQGTHNVIYVVTQADSVYAIDADTGAQLWWVNFTNPAQGITTAQLSDNTLPCGPTYGFNQEGIIGTPVIDPTNNTMYLVAKTVLNGTVRHHLHALDITTGNDQPGSPVLITAQSTSNKGHVTVFNSLHQKNRPGLLLLNGVLYLGFGSNGCNDANSGWVLSYDEATLSPLAVFNTSPDYGLTSIWQAGNGLAADEAGYIYVETAETGPHGYDVPNGGQTYCNSVVKLSPTTLEVADYFTPWSVAFLNSHDLDLSSTGALILPDQDGPYVHELIAGGKQGWVYVLDRDNMGMYSASDSQIIQEFNLIPGTPIDSTNAPLFGSPAYWNNTVYYAPDAAPLMAFPLSGGLLGTPLTTGKYVGSHSPSISANGNTNGVMWVISGPQLYAFDAVSLQLLYGTDQAPNNRDTLPPVGHFVTQTVANGKVYVATQNSLEAYGLLQVVSVSGTSVTIAAPGATTGNTSAVTIAPVNGFVGVVSLACALTATPVGAQYPPICSIPSSVSISGTSAATATMTIYSTAATSGALVYPWLNRTRWLAANGEAILAAMFLLGIPARGRRRRSLLNVAFVLAMLGSFVGCGGGGSNGGGTSGTTPGTYTFTVTATGQGVPANTAVVVTIK